LPTLDARAVRLSPAKSYRSPQIPFACTVTAPARLPSPAPCASVLRPRVLRSPPSLPQTKLGMAPARGSVSGSPC
jgi:hypothetical protein